MAQDCPLCFSKGVFASWNCLKDSLVSLSTRSFTCPLCYSVQEGLDKFTLHLVSHEMEAKKQQQHQLLQRSHHQKPTLPEDVPTISIKEGSNFDTLDELLADFSEFVKQEDKVCYDHHQTQNVTTKADNPTLNPRTVCGDKIFANVHAPLPLPSHQPHEAQSQGSISSAQGQQVPTVPSAKSNQVVEMDSSPSSPSMAAAAATSSQVQCSLCGWNFDNDNFLQLHMVLMHSKKNQAVLQRRMKRAVEEYKCRHCNDSGSSFAVYEDYINHLKVVHNDHRFVCHICAKIFKLRGSLLVHLRVVHSPLGDGTKRRRKHEKKHSVETSCHQPCQCNQCGVTFEEKGEFEIHMETHQNVPLQNTNDHHPYKCQICQRSFFTQAALWIHSVSHQQNISGIDGVSSNESTSPSLVKVPACTTNQGSPQPSGNPATSTNPSEKSGFKCPTCDKVFKRESHLNQHLKVHDNKQWECDVCKKAFTTKYFLKKHKRLHTGETPYACPICGKSFTFQQSYHKHMLYHTDDKPYTCAQCGRAFKELSTLQNHERIHSGERPFACETCGKSFRQRVSYLVHRRIHTGVMPYVCNDCGKSFRYKVTQRTHKCVGKFDDITPTATPLSNPLAEENASIEPLAIPPTVNSSGTIDLPQQIKEDLMSFRKSRNSSNLQNRYLQKSKERPNPVNAGQSQIPSPIGNQLEHLSLSDNLNHQSQSMPNIDAILFESTTTPTNVKPEFDPSAAIIKTESVDDFDLQAFL